MARSVLNRTVWLQTFMSLESSEKLPSSSPCNLPPLNFPNLLTSRHGYQNRVNVTKTDIKGSVSTFSKNKGSVSSKQAAVPVFMPQIHKWKPSDLNNNPSQLIPPLFRPWTNSSTRALGILIENGIISCQNFTLFAVAGSLIGSVLCFLEGCFLVLKSYSGFFRIIPSMADQGQVVKLIVEAIDMFLVGTAVLTFGMALHTMFVGSAEMKQTRGSQIATSNYGNFNLKKLKQGMETQSIARAKTKVGHAILLLLQAGMMEKFTNVPLVSGLDLACFAGAVMLSAASVFLLSRLSTPLKQSTKLSST